MRRMRETGEKHIWELTTKLLSRKTGKGKDVMMNDKNSDRNARLKKYSTIKFKQARKILFKMIIIRKRLNSV